MLVAWSVGEVDGRPGCSYLTATRVVGSNESNVPCSGHPRRDGGEVHPSHQRRDGKPWHSLDRPVRTALCPAEESGMSSVLCLAALALSAGQPDAKKALEPLQGK